jgi:hypothetical protein
LRQFVQPPLYSVLLDRLEVLAVYPGCSAIGFAAFAGKGQNVFSIDLVVQRISYSA